MKLLVPFGTRPEIVKLAPVVTALRAGGDDVVVVATGQHHDAALTDVFYTELGVRPDITLEVRGDAARRLGTIVTGALNVVAGERPDAVLVMGDTHTVPAYCLAGRNHAVPVVHLEAGLRSFNPTSVEEVNRRVAAAACSLHLAPTALARRFLLDEGVPAERIAVVGNPVLDALRAIGATRRPVEERAGVLLTAHRATNVDDPERLDQLVTLVGDLASTVGPVTFPVHPRTRAALENRGWWDRIDVPGVTVVDPVPYSTMIGLLAASAVVVTDSGGLQEEASWLGVPVVVLRRSTPRWEGVHDGSSVLTGLDAARALKAAIDLTAPDVQRRVAELPCPYGDGHTGERVSRLLRDPATAALLRLDEPDYVDRTPSGGAGVTALVRGVLLDLDDTLYPQADALDEAWWAVAERGARYGLDRRELFVALQIDASAGTARGGIIDRAVARTGGSPRLVPDLLTAFRGAVPERLVPYPGVRDALLDLLCRVPLALVTDGNPEGQRRKLAALGLEAMFDVVVFSDFWGRDKRKPHPHPFRQALSALEVDAGEAVMIGDRPDKDVAGATGVGMRAIRVATGEYTGQPDHPATWFRTDSFTEAVERLLPHLPPCSTG